MNDPKIYFDACRVISLKRTPQRLESFRERVAACNWPFAEISTTQAIDGKLCEPTPWWHCGPGAWGAFRSHLRVIEDALNSGVNRILILEDDCEFTDGFAEKAIAFLDALPANSELAYLGGQLNHYHQNVERINDLVARPQSVNRLHCYMLTRSGMTKAYRHLCRMNWDLGQRIEENGVVHWVGAHHIDHHLERLSKDRQIATYCPHEWLVNQSASYSEITNRHMPERSFNDTPKQTIFAVLGPYGGGTSAVAGAMHNMGIPMGQRFIIGDKQHSPRGCYEAVALFNLCQTCYAEPDFHEVANREQRISLLRKWKKGRETHGVFIGAKHPKLCLMIPEMREAWPGCKFVCVHRNIDAAIDSFRRMGLRWSKKGGDRDEIIRWLIETRDRDLQDIPDERKLHIEYDDLCENTETCLKIIAKFCGIEPKPEHYAKAFAFIDGSLNHFRDGAESESIATVAQENQNGCKAGTCGCRA